MSLRLVISAKVADKTGPWLRDALIHEGVTLVERGATTNGMVGLGVELESSVPALNANGGIGQGKLAQLKRLREHSVQVPDFAVHDTPRMGSRMFDYPVFGRKNSHSGGEDIKLYLQKKDFEYKGPSDYYVRFIPSVAEYRVWVFRQEALAFYDKVLARPELCGFGWGRNEKNGFVFKFNETLARDNGLKNLAIKAVAALDLDFGAVDIIKGEDNELYVLEVNTAPGANGHKAVGLVKLAKRIAKWEATGFPDRSR
jgi:hypothetical protein